MMQWVKRRMFVRMEIDSRDDAYRYGGDGTRAGSSAHPAPVRRASLGSLTSSRKQVQSV